MFLLCQHLYDGGANEVGTPRGTDLIVRATTAYSTQGYPSIIEHSCGLSAFERRAL